jgi:hypothetical protein
VRPDAFAPAYATVAPGVATRVMVAHAALITGLAELQSMTADRLRVDQATVLDPIANALPAVDAGAEQPAPTRRRRAHRWPRSWHCRAPHRPSAQRPTVTAVTAVTATVTAAMAVATAVATVARAVAPAAAGGSGNRDRLRGWHRATTGSDCPTPHPRASRSA